MGELAPLRAGAVAGGIALAFFALGINAQPHGWWSWHRLAVEGRKAQAVVTATNPEQHHSCTFSYLVDGREMQGTGVCDRQPGEAIFVTYLPSDPSFATTKSPDGEFLALIIAPVALSLFACMVVAMRVALRQQKQA